MTKNGVLAIALTVLFAELAVILRQTSEGLVDFIPFFQVIKSGRLYVSAYDAFFVLAVLAFRIFYRYYGINPSVLKRGFQAMGTGRKPQDLAAYIGAGIVMHFLVCPLLYNIFVRPLTIMISAPDVIRRIAIVSLVLLWGLVLGFLSRTMAASSYNPPPSPMSGGFQGMQMPTPP